MLYSSKRSPYWFCYIFSLTLNYFVEKPQEQKKSPTEKIVWKSFSRSITSALTNVRICSVVEGRERRSFQGGAYSSQFDTFFLSSFMTTQFNFVFPETRTVFQKKSVNQVSDAISANRPNSLFVGLSFFSRKMLWSFQQVRKKTELTGRHFKVDTSVRKFHWLLIIFCTNNLHLIYN